MSTQETTVNTNNTTIGTTTKRASSKKKAGTKKGAKKAAKAAAKKAVRKPSVDAKGSPIYRTIVGLDTVRTFLRTKKEAIVEAIQLLAKHKTFKRSELEADKFGSAHNYAQVLIRAGRLGLCSVTPMTPDVKGEERTERTYKATSRTTVAELNKELARREAPKSVADKKAEKAKTASKKVASKRVAKQPAAAKAA